jgi:hypothetical protein
VKEGYEVKIKPVTVTVEETEKEKVDTSASVEEKENRKKHAKTLYLIQQAISDKIFPRIIGARSSNDKTFNFKEKFSEFANEGEKDPQGVFLKSD